MDRNWLNTDTATGTLVAVFGALSLWMGADYVAGAATRMGPGYVPRLLGALCMLMGIGLAAYGCFSRPEPAQALSVRPVLFVLSGIAVFAALIETAGLAVTAIAVVAIVSQARKIGRAHV